MREGWGAYQKFGHEENKHSSDSHEQIHGVGKEQVSNGEGLDGILIDGVARRLDHQGIRHWVQCTRLNLSNSVRSSNDSALAVDGDLVGGQEPLFRVEAEHIVACWYVISAKQSY